MCLICDRIEMIKNGTNKYFVKELETGYVVINILKDTHCSFLKNIKLNCFNSIIKLK